MLIPAAFAANSKSSLSFISHLKKEPLASLPTGIGCIPSLVLLSKVFAWLQGK
jgi:hypothetical protein